MSLSLSEWRRVKNISQTELADKCRISVMTLRTWEEHPDMIRMKYIPIIADALGIEPKDLFLSLQTEN